MSAVRARCPVCQVVASATPEVVYTCADCGTRLRVPVVGGDSAGVRENATNDTGHQSGGDDRAQTTTSGGEDAREDPLPPTIDVSLRTILRWGPLRLEKLMEALDERGWRDLNSDTILHHLEAYSRYEQEGEEWRLCPTQAEDTARGNASDESGSDPQLNLDINGVRLGPVGSAAQAWEDLGTVRHAGYWWRVFDEMMCGICGTKPDESLECACDRTLVT